MFTQQELKTILTLLNRVNITGQESLPVAVLMQKIEGLIKEEPKKEEKK